MSDDLLKSSHLAVLCGGRGVRLKPATDSIPKALVELKGRPILDYILENAGHKGLREVTLCLGYKGHLIKERYASNPFGLKIHFSEAGEEAGMLKRIAMLGTLPHERFIITYGDTFIDLNMAQMLKAHQAKQAKATMLTATIRSPFGRVTTDPDGWVALFEEKPLMNYYVGCFVLERSAIRDIPEAELQQNDAGGLLDFFLNLSRAKQLAAYQYEGPQITFNTETERRIAEENLMSYYTLTKAEET